MKNSKTFHLKDGKTFSSLKSFAKELKTMSSEVYTHHVSHHHNDFSNWLKHSLNKEELANKLSHTKNILEAELLILRELVHNESKKLSSKVQKQAKVITKKVTKKRKTNIYKY